MKKILWLIILIPIFMTSAFASETYYSEYSDFSDYQEENIEDSDTVNVEEVTMYKWYKEIKIPGDYKLYNSYDKFTDDCYETEYSSWSKSKPEVAEATILNERTMYNYQMIKPIRYIHLYNLDGSYSAFRITELQVFFKDKEIDYTYSCIGCWQDFDKFIHNGIYKENMSIIDDGGSLIIDLGREYPINKINLIIYLFDIGTEDKKYTIGYSNDGKNIFVNKSYTQQFTLYYAKDSIKYEYNLEDFNVEDSLWLTSQISEQYLDNDFVYSRTSYKEYRYKEKNCRTYTMGKEYYPQYSIKSVSDYILKDSPKIFYRYQTRDKLQLNMHDITEKNFDLNNFVLYHSDEYKISDNINWDKNGTYKVNFTLNDINVSKTVKVNILSNAIEEKETEIKELEEQLKSTINDYEKIIESLEKNNAEYLNSLNNLNEQIIQLNNEIEILKGENVNQNEEIIKLEDELNLKVKEYEENVNNLENINKLYLENLNILSNNIFDLDSRLTFLEDNHQSMYDDINGLKAKMEEYIKEYDAKIKYLQEFNFDCLEKLEGINLTIKNINEYLKEFKLNNENRYEELDSKIENHAIYINDIRTILNSNIEEFLNINSEIDKLKEKIQQLEFSNNDIYDSLTSELENSKQIMNEKLENLKVQIKNLELEISNLNNNNEIDEQQIKELQDKLEENIIIYKAEIEKLNEVNKLYFNKLDILNADINNLDEQLKSVINNENNNNLNIQNIEAELEKHNKQYNEIVDDLNEFNQQHLTNMKDIENKFKNIFTKVSNLEVLNNKKFKELNDLINYNSTLLSDIENNNNNKYIELIKNQNNINNKIDDYKEVISDLKNLNDQYVLQITILQEEMKKLGIEIEQIKQNSSAKYEVIENNQRLIYEEIIKTTNEILNIKQNQIIDNEDLENIKSQILYVSNKVEDTKEIEDSGLNSKLNDYMLKINGIEVINLLWIYIVFTILFAIYLIHIFKKSRMKK